MTEPPQRTPADFNLFDPAVLECPFDFYAVLREQAPAYEIPFMGFWMITRHEDVKQVVADPKTFSSVYPDRFGTGLSFSPRTDKLDEVLATGYQWKSSLLFTDPPVHTRHRRIIAAAFSPRRIRQLETTVRTIANELIDGLAGVRQIDFVERYSMPLAITVIADALGVNRQDTMRFKSWSDTVVARLGNFVPEEQDIALLRDYVDFQHYFVDLVEQKRREPVDDLLTDLVSARPDGDAPLDDEELLSFLTVLLVAGNETTTSLMNSMMLHLLGDPNLMSEVRGDPGVIASLVEETLRFQSPIQMFFRKTTREVTVGDATIPPESMILVGFGAANRDDRKFTCPEVFDAHRDNAREHLAFSFGPHVCPGAGLGRAEARIGVETFLSRFGTIALAEGEAPRFVPNFMARTVGELPITLAQPS
jgi:cytochrome P450